MTLDVGCGNVASGDVNVDLFIEKTAHRVDQSLINIKRIPNFVIASGMSLPFKDHTFGYVISKHVLEHVDNPFSFLKELARVSCDRVAVIVPHRFDKGAKTPSHKTFWSVTRLYNMINRLENIYSANAFVLTRRGFPHVYLSLVSMPYEILGEFRVSLRKV